MNISFDAGTFKQRGWLFLVLPLLCLLVYTRGLFGGFVFDDFGSIVQNPALRVLDGSASHWLALAFSSNAGILRRPLSMLSFGIDYSLFGLNPLAFKITNLAIHLINGALLYALMRRITAHLLPRSSDKYTFSRTLALLAVSLWLLHPLNVGSVLYVVQRMNLLASLFMLMGLLCYVEGRERILRGEHGWITALGGLSLFGILATLSKENGALIVTYAWAIESISYRFSAPNRQQERTIKGFFWLSVTLPLVLLTAYIITHPQWLAAGYAGRTFTLHERLLTEPRILCDYLLWIFVPLPQWMGMFHDDIVVSSTILNPPTTLLAIIFLISLIVTAWLARKRFPALSFGIAWFLAGHAMESTVLPLELVFDHRNYLPMAGLLLGVIVSVSPAMFTRFGTKQSVVMATTVLAIFSGITMTRATDWSSELRLAKSEVAHHPNSSRAQYEMGRQIIFTGSAAGRREQAEQEAVAYFERAKALDTTDLFGASSLIIIHGRNGKVIDPTEIDDLARRVKTILQPQINPFLVVQTAATDGSISIEPEQMKKMTESALDNPVFPSTVRAMLLNNYGHYLFQIEHDNQAAVSLTLAAAAEDPQNPLFQINMTKLALALGETDIAYEHLNIAKQLDITKTYTTPLTELALRIDNAKNSTSTQSK